MIAKLAVEIISHKEGHGIGMLKASTPQPWSRWMRNIL
jgi:hypothetical protein